MLRFVLLEQILEQAEERFEALTFDDNGPHFSGPAGDAEFAKLLSTRILSLRDIAYVDWYFVMEPLVVFDAILREDPGDGLREDGLRQPRGLSQTGSADCALLRLHGAGCGAPRC